MNSEHAYQDTFFIVPRYIRQLPGLTLAFLDVYETIFQFWNKGLPCFLSNPAICARTGISLRQVKEALTFFEAKGQLKREKKGLKRFLIQPERRIEISEDEEGAPPPCSTYNTQEGAPPPQAGRSSAPQEGAPAPTEYKEVEYKETNTNIGTSVPSPSGRVSLDPNYQYPETLYEKKKPKRSLTTEVLLTNNPFNIPEAMIRDWQKSRKAPITETAWKSLLKELGKCKEAGINPAEAFEEMVSRGWRSLKKDWLSNKSADYDHKNTKWIKNLYNEYGF